jgi:hypothetical protein
MAAASVLVACGDGDHRLSDEAAAVLAPRVEAIRAAAAAGDRSAAQAEAGRLRLTLDDLQAAGAVDKAEASAVLEALRNVEQQFSLLPEPTSTTTITTTTTTTAPSNEGDDDKGPRKKGKGDKDD